MIKQFGELFGNYRIVEDKKENVTSLKFNYISLRSF